jgi:hypothetical protein
MIHKISLRLASAGVALLAVTNACARNHVEHDLDATMIRLVRDSVPLQRTADMVSFTVNVVIANRGATPVVVGGCGPEVQRQISGEWQTVWSPVCIDMQSSLISPEDSLTGPVTPAGFTKPGFEPPLDPRMTAGTYRLRFGVSYPDPANVTALTSTEFVNSPPFVVYSP